MTMIAPRATRAHNVNAVDTTSAASSSDPCGTHIRQTQTSGRQTDGGTAQTIAAHTATATIQPLDPRRSIFPD